jgi:sigma-B regulation protein RsbU (phosphoserine phosphatase)
MIIGRFKPLKETQALETELSRLKNVKAALQIQSRLLEKFVTIARSASKERVLTAILQKTLEISTELTGAEKGSLFLLDSSGAVTDSILTRQDATPEQSARIIGQVLNKGLAGWVQLHRKAGLILDTNNDERWLNLPNQPYTVGSALAVPILRGDNLLGILTLLHARPGHFTAETADLMLLTARQIGSALENVRLYTQLDESYQLLKLAKLKIEDYSKALDAEMEKGKKIQRDFLPDQIPRIQGWEIAACFLPAKQVSGDFYDVFLLPGDLVGLVIADICDKGVGSALFMALFRSLIRVFSGQINLQGVTLSFSGIGGPYSTGGLQYRALHAVSLTNDYIAAEHGEESMFATLFFGVLDPRNGEMTYVNGGHEPVLIVNRSGVKERLKATGPVVGMSPESQYEVKRIVIEPGDILIGYTDGVTEALSPRKEFFTKKQFFRTLENPAPTASKLIEQIKGELGNHMDGAPQFDDIAMLAVHRKI